jgi:hypothetical protein
VLGVGGFVKYEVTLRGSLSPSPDDDGEPQDVFERAFDRTMVEMLKLRDLEDPSVSGSIASGEIELAAAVDAEDYGSAVSKADAAMRAALHAAEIGTQIWNTVPQHIRIHCIVVEEVMDDDSTGGHELVDV